MQNGKSLPLPCLASNLATPDPAGATALKHGPQWSGLINSRMARVGAPAETRLMHSWPQLPPGIPGRPVSPEACPDYTPVPAGGA